MIIVLAQQKGGAGKTTVAAHLAHAFALDGKAVGLADLDPQRSLSQWGKAAAGLGLEVIESAGWRAGSDIKDLARRAEVTLIDCPGNASSLLEAALREADLVLVPCQPTLLDAWATAPVLEMAKKEKTPARVVFNRVPPRGGMAAEAAAVLAQAGAELLTATLGNRVAFSNGMGQGTTALGLSRSSAAAQEVMALKAELEGLV